MFELSYTKLSKTKCSFWSIDVGDCQIRFENLPNTTAWGAPGPKSPQGALKKIRKHEALCSVVICVTGLAEIVIIDLAFQAIRVPLVGICAINSDFLFWKGLHGWLLDQRENWLLTRWTWATTSTRVCADCEAIGMQTAWTVRLRIVFRQAMIDLRIADSLSRAPSQCSWHKRSKLFERSRNLQCQTLTILQSWRRVAAR